MGKRVKMKAWRGWCPLDENGDAWSVFITKKAATYYAGKYPVARVLVTEIPPKAKKARRKEKR